MELTSKDGNMVVDYYPVKDFDNNLINNRMLKVLSFRGDTQKKMLITRDEFYYQVREYIMKYKYSVTNEDYPVQFISKYDYANDPTLWASKLTTMEGNSND
jgi:hypothetical protein